MPLQLKEPAPTRNKDEPLTPEKTLQTGRDSNVKATSTADVTPDHSSNAKDEKTKSDILAAPKAAASGSTPPVARKLVVAGDEE